MPPQAILAQGRAHSMVHALKLHGLKYFFLLDLRSVAEATDGIWLEARSVDES